MFWASYLGEDLNRLEWNFRKMIEGFLQNKFIYKKVSLFQKLYFYSVDMMSSLTHIFPVCCAICCICVVGYRCTTNFLHNYDKASGRPWDQQRQVGKCDISSKTNAIGQRSLGYGFKRRFIDYYLVINESTLTLLFQQLL